MPCASERRSCECFRRHPLPVSGPVQDRGEIRCHQWHLERSQGALNDAPGARSRLLLHRRSLRGRILQVESDRISRNDFVRLVVCTVCCSLAPSCTDDDEIPGDGASGDSGSGNSAGTRPSGFDGAAAGGSAGSGVGGSGNSSGVGGGSAATGGASGSDNADSGQAGSSGTSGSGGTGASGGVAGSAGSGGSTGVGGPSGTGGLAGATGDGGLDGMCQIAMTNQHPMPHTLAIPAADIASPESRVYVLRGTLDHAHDLLMSADNFSTLAAGGTVEIYSRQSLGHYHIVTISSC